RVTFAPVLFTNRRRTDSVPNVELLPGLLVRSRTRFGDTDCALVVSSKLMLMLASRLIGDVRFSGPGAPSCCVTPEMKVPCVSANLKSAALSFVSFGVPAVVHPTPLTKSHSLRKNECCVVVPETGGKVLPSLKRSHTPPPVFESKPTASSRFTLDRLLMSAVEKIATSLSLSMSEVIV